MASDPKTLLDAVQYFSNYENCKEWMVALRWPNGVKCPRCGSDHVVFLENAKAWKCYAKHPQAKFTLKTGTIYEDSPLGLDKWLPATWMIVNDKNGISSWELHRALGVTQKTAWFMLHRIRLAMQDEGHGGKLCGEIEVDETYIGGKARNMRKGDKARKMQGKRGGSDGGNKTIVLGILERKGIVRATVIPDRKKATIKPVVKQTVQQGSELNTDEHEDGWYGADEYAHNVVNHLQTYVDGSVHTNGLENFWSLLKRGINGTYVSVEPFHLFRYVDEQAFRYNNRGAGMNDYMRFRYVMRKIVGKRLTYDQLTGKEGETEAF
ncbi:MAG TPA: IS1595 family transposase [Bryobacteraceae bacterium]|nr:IS1595 family transposase [Bryobacteraceae bacterium]